MKNKLILGLSLLLIGSSLAGCGEDPKVGPKALELAREFVSSMKKDTNDFNNLVYESAFRQDYSVNYVSETADETTDYSLVYRAQGSVTSGYYFGGNVPAEVTSAKIFNEGTGYFAGRQSEIAKLTHLTTPKTKKGKSKNTKADYSLKHTFGVQFDGQKLYALGENELTNRLADSNTTVGKFCGTIDRKDAQGKPVIGQFGEAVIEKTISRILYLQSWSTISKFKDATVKYFQSLDLTKDEDAKKFVLDKQVESNDGESILKVNFVLDGDSVLEQIAGKAPGIAAQIKGSVEINKATKLVTASNYDFKDLLFATLSKGSASAKTFNVSVSDYYLSTHLTASAASQLKLEGNFTQYATTDGTTFMNNFEKYVVPSLDNVEVNERGEPVK